MQQYATVESGEVQFLRRENETLLAKAKWLEETNSRLKVEVNRLRVENEELCSRSEAASLSCDWDIRERCVELEAQLDLLRGMVCIHSDDCFEFDSLTESKERYNADD